MRRLGLGEVDGAGAWGESTRAEARVEGVEWGVMAGRVEIELGRSLWGWGGWNGRKKERGRFGAEGCIVMLGCDGNCEFDGVDFGAWKPTPKRPRSAPQPTPLCPRSVVKRPPAAGWRVEGGEVNVRIRITMGCPVFLVMGAHGAGIGMRGAGKEIYFAGWRE